MRLIRIYVSEYFGKFQNEYWEINFLFSQLHFMEITVEISILFRLQKIGTEDWAVCDASKMLMMKVSRRTRNPEKKI